MSRYIDAELLEPDTEWDDYDDRYVSYSQLEIDSAPTADVRENVKARYVYDPVQMAYRCSNCNQLFVCRELSPEPPSFNYCPNCGADMRGEA